MCSTALTQIFLTQQSLAFPSKSCLSICSHIIELWKILSFQSWMSYAFLLIFKKLLTKKPIPNQVLTHFPLSLFLGVYDSQTQFPCPPHTRCWLLAETILPQSRWLWRAEKSPALSSSSSLFVRGINNWVQADLPTASNIMYSGSFDGGNLPSQSYRRKSHKLCS